MDSRAVLARDLRLFERAAGRSAPPPRGRERAERGGGRSAHSADCRRRASDRRTQRGRSGDRRQDGVRRTDTGAATQPSTTTDLSFIRSPRSNVTSVSWPTAANAARYESAQSFVAGCRMRVSARHRRRFAQGRSRRQSTTAIAPSRDIDVADTINQALHRYAKQ
jgi:hypothetical protein